MMNATKTRPVETVRTGEQNEFLHDVLHGLSCKPKRLPCKYFYDLRGSQLFDRICLLEEYYVTRTEVEIMNQSIQQIATALGEHVLLVEFGSGSSTKTLQLLQHCQRLAGYIPVDISAEHLQNTARQLQEQFPKLVIKPLAADFTQPLVIPKVSDSSQRKVVYFPGSTIGNFTPAKATALLRQIALEVDAGGGLLIGIDLVKDTNVLEAAYNDSQGITAAFNLNLLRRINRELHGTFRVDLFQHRAHFDTSHNRIEMHLISKVPQVVSVANNPFQFAAQETICTEYSHKYVLEDFLQMAAGAGFAYDQHWTDPQSYFAIIHLIAK